MVVLQMSSERVYSHTQTEVQNPVLTSFVKT